MHLLLWIVIGIVAAALLVFLGRKAWTELKALDKLAETEHNRYNRLR
jgi:hypothetical protein